MNVQEYLQSLLNGAGDFELLVTQLLNPDNTARKSAEEVYQQLKLHPDACLQHLVKCLRTSQTLATRSTCAVLLRKVLQDCTSADSAWKKSSPQAQVYVKNELLNSITSDPERSVRMKVSDTVSELGCYLLDTNEWPELIPFLFQCAQSGQAGLIENSLSVFGGLAVRMVDALVPHITALHELVKHALGHADKDVRVAGLRAITYLIQGLEDEPKLRDSFQDTIPGMVAFLSVALNGGEEVLARDVIEMFIEIAEMHPKFLKSHLTESVGVMLAVARTEKLEDDTRQLAAEFLVTMCESREKAPGMMRKLPQFVQNLFEVLLHFLLDVEDCPEWYSAENDEDMDEGEGELCQAGQECLDRLALSLGGNSIVPFAAQILMQWLNDAAWQKRFATFICLAQIAEGCSKVMLKQLDALVAMCLKGLQDPHGRVRWASCQALGQMCSDLGPDIQKAQHAHILPALMAVMDDFQSPFASRVQAHASAAVVNFSEGCDSSLMTPYLEPLCGKLITLLRHGRRIVQEGALTALASVADCAQEYFAKYYDVVMPLLLEILAGANEKSQRLLRAKALECATLVGMAVGKDKFRADAQKVMQVMQHLHSSELEADDPSSGYMLQAGARLCKTLGEEMIPYLEYVMPPLLKSAQQSPDVKVKPVSDDEDDDDDDDDDDVEKITLGDKVVSIRTSTLEEKATACNMLCCYADELKEGFLPFLKQVTDIMVPLLTFYFHEDVRQAAVNALPALLKVAQAAQEKGMGPDAAYIQDMVSFMWPKLMDAMLREPDWTIMASMMESLAQMLEILDRAFITGPMVQEAFERFKDTLTKTEGRREERLRAVEGEELDEEDREALEEKDEEEEEVIDQMGSAMSELMKKFGDDILPLVEGLLPHLEKLVARHRNPEDKRIAICIMDDVIDHCPTGRVKYSRAFMPFLLDGCASEHPDLRQCSAFGIGVVAAKSPDIFKPFLVQCVAVLVKMLQLPDARDEEYSSATDNVVAALGKILEHTPDLPDSAAVAAAWLSGLPLKDDPIEAVPQHTLLVRLIEAGDERVLGPNNANVAQLASVLMQVLARGTQLISGEVGLRAVAMLQKMIPLLPPNAMAQQLSELSPEEQQALNGYMVGAIPPS